MYTVLHFDFLCSLIIYIQSVISLIVVFSLVLALDLGHFGALDPQPQFFFESLCIGFLFEVAWYRVI